MKLMGITVDKKIENGCKLDFCIDDEMSWVVVRPAEDSDVDKIFLWEGSEVGCCVSQIGNFSGKVHDIDMDTHSFYIGENLIEDGTQIHAIGIIGDDNRPRKEK